MAYANAHRTPLPVDSSGPSASGTSSRLAFTVDPAKLHPGFEAYKLADDAESSVSARGYALPSRPPQIIDLYQPTRSGEGAGGKLTFTGLGYKETKARALHQLLIPASGRDEPEDPFAAYIDANRFVVLLTYIISTDRVTAHPVHRLEERDGLPSLASIDPTTWIACNGETLSLIKLRKVNVGQAAARWTSETVTVWTIPEVQGGATIKAHRRTRTAIQMLLQTTRTISKATSAVGKDMQGLGFHSESHKMKTGANAAVHSSTVFDVHLVEIIDAAEEAQEERSARLLGTVQGDEPLLTAQLDGEEWILTAEAPFSPPSHATSQPTHISPPQTKPPAAHDSAGVGGGKRRRASPHLSWAQTDDTVTIAFALPAWLTTSHVRGHFSPAALSLSLTPAALALLEPSAQITELTDSSESIEEGREENALTRAGRMIGSGRYVSRATWGEIDAAGSVWTLERAGGASLLTLHLEKKHAGTRWPSVFADRTRAPARTQAVAKTQVSFAQARSQLERTAAGLHTDEQDEEEAEGAGEDYEDEVPETLDPSELLTMLEGLQKYTVDQGTTGLGHDRTGLSLDQPSLLKDGLEEEDANVGLDFVVTTVTFSASNTTVRRSDRDDLKVLATFLPSDQDQRHGLVGVKHGLDGAVFAREGQGWVHAATMPALAFVLASKRDAQRVHLHPRGQSRGEYVALAFESAPQVTGSGEGGGGKRMGRGAGNLFLYYTPSEAGGKHAPSRVIRLGAIDDDAKRQAEEEEGASGALLGVCSVRLPAFAGEGQQGAQGEDTLVCLCENRLLLLRGVL